MIKTTYTCDKCQGVLDNNNQFWTVGVWATNAAGSYSQFAVENKLSIQVCRPCLEGLGVHVQKVTKESPSYVERTTEDILRELINRVQP